MSNFNYIYESAQIQNFERQILSGYLTESKIMEMIEKNELTTEQAAVVVELFGGLSNLGRAATNAVGAGVRGVKNAIGTGMQKAGQAVNAGVAGAKQMGQNVKNIYQTGEQQRAAQQQVQTLDKLLAQINQIIAQVRQTNPQLANFIGKNPTLSNLTAQIKKVAQSAQNKANAALQQGVTGGVGAAAANAYNQPNQQVQQQVQPTP